MFNISVFGDFLKAWHIGDGLWVSTKWMVNNGQENWKMQEKQNSKSNEINTESHSGIDSFLFNREYNVKVQIINIKDTV